MKIPSGRAASSSARTAMQSRDCWRRFPVSQRRLKCTAFHSHARDQPLVAILREQHQSLPVLVFDESRPVPENAEVSNGRRFIDSSERILRYLADRYSFPYVLD
ncbi:hypothetical protein ACVWXO_007149 [Bradyrhizobium sp. LM2.7]